MRTFQSLVGIHVESHRTSCLYTQNILFTHFFHIISMFI
nr:MAG TPA: hypothetical protein [Caudoviricetes sp.]